MNKNQNTNRCYVFSQTTLDLALKEWQELEISNKASQEESVLITLAALPWFFQHLNQSGPTYVFTNELLHSEIESWKAIQITNYPNQVDRIVNSCELLLRFFNSELIKQHKMIIETD